MTEPVTRNTPPHFSHQLPHSKYFVKYALFDVAQQARINIHSFKWSVDMLAFDLIEPNISITGQPQSYFTI